MYNFQYGMDADEYNEWRQELIFHLYTPYTVKDPEKIAFMCQEFRMDERYIRENIDYLDWKVICGHQKMSGDFINEMSIGRNTPWFLIVFNQEVSEKWIDEHWEEILNTSNSRDDWMYHLNTTRLFTSRVFSRNFFMKHYDCLNWKNILTIHSLDTDLFIRMYGKYIEELGLDKNVYS